MQRSKLPQSKSERIRQERIREKRDTHEGRESSYNRRLSEGFKMLNEAYEPDDEDNDE